MTGCAGADHSDHYGKEKIGATLIAWTDELTTLISLGLTFGTIMADPPWQYGNQATRASTKHHYDTMTLADLAALPIASLAAPASHLHLWTTAPLLFDAQDIMESWGFKYASILVWVKPQLGLGNYWRVGTEFLLLGIRGGCRFRCHDKPNWLQCRRGRHSRKPDLVRTWIEQVSPGPYLELFGREAVDGWTVYGNEPPALLVPGPTTQPRCLVCAKPFPSRRRTGKYCGPACKQVAYRQRVTLSRSMSTDLA